MSAGLLLLSPFRIAAMFCAQMGSAYEARRFPCCPQCLWFPPDTTDVPVEFQKSGWTWPVHTPEYCEVNAEIVRANRENLWMAYRDEDTLLPEEWRLRRREAVQRHGS